MVETERTILNDESTRRYRMPSNVVPGAFVQLLSQYVARYKDRTEKRQADLAESIGRSPEWLSRLLNGRPGPFPRSSLVIEMGKQMELSAEEMDELLLAGGWSPLSVAEADLGFRILGPLDGIPDPEERAFLTKAAYDDHETLVAMWDLYAEMVGPTYQGDWSSFDDATMSRGLELADKLERAGHRLRALRMLVQAQMFREIGAAVVARRTCLHALKESRQAEDLVVEALIRMELGDLACNAGKKTRAERQYELASEALVLSWMRGQEHPFLYSLARRIDTRTQAL